jgi:hypothetical protein
LASCSRVQTPRVSAGATPLLHMLFQKVRKQCSRSFFISERISRVFRDLGHMALAELHQIGGFQPQMATESGEPPRDGIEKPRSAFGPSHGLISVTPFMRDGQIQPRSSSRLEDPAPILRTPLAQVLFNGPIGGISAATCLVCGGRTCVALWHPHHFVFVERGGFRRNGLCQQSWTNPRRLPSPRVRLPRTSASMR